MTDPSILDTAPQTTEVMAGVALIDSALRFRQVNAGAAVLLGDEVTALVGRPLEETLGRMVRPDVARRLLLQAERTLSQGISLVTRGVPLAPTATAGRRPAIDWQTVRRKGRFPVMLVLTEADSGDQLLGMMGHELRDPLHVIGLWTSSLLQSTGLHPTTRRGLASMQRVAARAGRVIRDFLDVAQIRQAGTLPLSLSRVDLRQVVKQAISEAQMMFPTRTLSHRFVGLVAGRWDADRLTQVLLNLITNALKYSPEDSRVEVEAGRDGRWAYFRVHNSGPPIAPGRVGSLFQPWHASGPGASGRLDGRGLGLYIVQQLIHAHQGELLVDSTPARGTTFTVRLPRQVPRATRPPPGDRPPLGALAPLGWSPGPTIRPGCAL
jgi:signal transduction histidine kinase